MFYDHEEMQLIFRDYVENDGQRWMSFFWEMVDPAYLVDIKPASIWRGQRDAGEKICAAFSNGTTSRRTAKEFAWDYYINRGIWRDHGRKVSVYRLASHSGMLCLRKVFPGEKRLISEQEVILRDAVWKRHESWVLGGIEQERFAA